MTKLRALESPLRAWRSFRDIARATQTLAAVQAMQWAERSARADAHLSWCEAVAAAHRLPPSPGPRPRVVLVLGTELGLCGSLNRELAACCERAGLDRAPTVLSVVVGSRLALLEPLAGARPIHREAPSSLPAARRLGAEIEDLINLLPDALAVELSIVLATAVDEDAHPRVELRTSARPDLELEPSDRSWLDRPRRELSVPASFAGQAQLLARNARLVAALCRAITSENEARWRTMSRAHESAQRRIGEQERRLRRLRQELITQEMLEARQGSGTSRQG
ncbi:F0F1 ATP synthase subunit gamma [Enhygromyxa salina]|uniref:F0F1 ATP synthase subunit gamma n=1 Tax=Enhygromyxa salina TaxID=215803 RepID=A0A2S9XI91_9BACT|nr:F0F1 ATP synthase subunit gamma [Enhygromyxa salina]PRP92594.1 F0F1 ATP synthase subunit gamma [Enhygromyxa salina]